MCVRVGDLNMSYGSYCTVFADVDPQIEKGETERKEERIENMRNTSLSSKACVFVPF